MKLDALKNPSPAEIAAMIAKSKHKAARRIVTSDGDAWYWPFEHATHRQAADTLGLAYDRPAGAGDVVFLD